MSYELMEGAVDALKDYFSENMADKVAVLNLEYNDSIEIQGMKAWYTSMKRAYPEYPCGVIRGLNGDPEGEGEGWMKNQHNIDVIILATDQDEEVLVRCLFRYIRAVVELAKASRSSIGYQVNIGSWDFSDIYQSDDGFLSGAKQSLFLKKYETV